MTQIYVTYLANFLDSEVVYSYLTELLKDATLVDWQRMWIVAALSQTKTATDSVVKTTLDLLKDAQRADPLRAVAAVFVEGLVITYAESS
jgi:hypothetical protein